MGRLGGVAGIEVALLAILVVTLPSSQGSHFTAPLIIVIIAVAVVSAASAAWAPTLRWVRLRLPPPQPANGLAAHVHRHQDETNPLVETMQFNTGNRSATFYSTDRPPAYLLFRRPQEIAIRPSDELTRIPCGKRGGYVRVIHFTPKGFSIEEVRTAGDTVTIEIHMRWP